MSDYIRLDLAATAARHGQQNHMLIDAAKHFCSDGIWIAGGAVRDFMQQRSIRSDIDVFFRDESRKDDFVKNWAPKKRYSSKTCTGWDGQFGDHVFRIQAIHVAYYESAEQVIDSFDFTVCQWAIDNEQIVTTPFAMLDTGRNRLAIHKVTYPVATIQRYVKYAKYGFGSCNGVAADIVKAVIANPSGIDTQVMYID